MNDLRDRLNDLADEAPPLTYDAQLFRRSRRRHRVRQAGGAATLIAAVAVGALAVPANVDRGAEPADGSSTGLPSHIVAVPDRVLPSLSETEAPTDTLPLEADLGVGRASAMLVTEQNRVIVIGAEDGRYHLLDLPGINEAQRFAAMGHIPGSNYNESGLAALSPDGARLAWAAYDVPPSTDPEDPDPDVIPTATGVRVADLTTGTVSFVDVPGPKGAVVAALTWSPDGRWLAYRVHPQGLATARERRVSRLERIDATALRREVVGEARNTGPLTVDDDGLVTDGVAATARWFRETSNADRAAIMSELATSDMSSVDIGPTTPSGGVPLTAVTGTGLVVLDGPTYTLQDADFPQGARLTLLGWQDETHPIVFATQAVGSGFELDGEILVLGGDEPALVSTVERDRMDAIFIAADLVRPGHESTDFATPDWPWTQTKRLAVFAGILGTGLVLLWIWGAVAWRRPRR